MKLQKVEIGSNLYVNKFEQVDKTITTEFISKEDYDNLSVSIPTMIDAVWKMSSIRIGFDTLTGELGDGQYATQENGFHWVKLIGYDLIKILPEFIINDILSDEGIEKIKKDSSEEK